MTALHILSGAMPAQVIDIRTSDGLCTSYVAGAAADGPRPAVLFFMDGIGIRPVLRAMADRIAAAGFYVLLPDLFYRLPGEGLPAGADWLAPANRPGLTQRVQSLTPELVGRDAGVFLDYLAAQPGVKPGSQAGVVGYCMGGSMALRTAAHDPDRIAVAASFHAGRLVTDTPASPHLLLGRIKAELYFGHADQDPGMTAAQIETLDRALQAAGVRYQAELYRGARHGFTMTDLPAYDPAACEQHWRRLLALLGRLR